MGSYGIQILLIIVLVVLSGLVSGAEAALAALGPHGVARLLDDERRRSALLRAWRDSPERVMTSLRVAVNAFNLLAAALAALLASTLMAERGVEAAAAYGIAVAVAALTFLIVLFSEVIPRSIARRDATMLLPTFPVVRLLCVVLSPVAWVVRVLSGPMLRGGAAPSITEH